MTLGVGKNKKPAMAHRYGCYLFFASARVVQVIQWTNKSKYRSHKEGVVLARIENPDYSSCSLFERLEGERRIFSKLN